MAHSTSWDLDLIAHEIASVEDLPETTAGGWSSAGTLSSASSAGSTLSSGATLSTYNS